MNYTFEKLGLEDPSTGELKTVLGPEKGLQLEKFIEKVEDLLQKDREMKAFFRKGLIDFAEPIWSEDEEIWSRKIVDGGEDWEDYHWSIEYHPITDMFRVCAGDQWRGDDRGENDHTAPESLYNELKELILEQI
jgi:hypothetical protein